MKINKELIIDFIKSGNYTFIVNNSYDESLYIKKKPKKKLFITDLKFYNKEKVIKVLYFNQGAEYIKIYEDKRIYNELQKILYSELTKKNLYIGIRDDNSKPLILPADWDDKEDYTKYLK